MSSLATLLKEARSAADMTQEQLAKKAKNGLTAADISKAERGLARPTDAQLKAIAKATGVTQKSLLDAARGTSAKKTSGTSASTAKKASATTFTASMRVTATEKRLIEAYRSASSENKKLAMNLLKGKAVEDAQLDIGSLLTNGVANGLGGLLENLIGGINK